MNYALQISALTNLPMSLYNEPLAKWGHTFIRSKDNIITGIIFDITGSAVTDYSLEYLLAVRNCIFSLDQEGYIYLDNEGQSISIDLNLQSDGNILCSVNLTDLEPTPFIDGAYAYDLGEKKIHNEIIGDGFYLTFSSSAESWCDSVIALAKNESKAYQLMAWGDPDNICDASGYIHDLETFRDRIAKRLDNQTINQIISEIELADSPPITK